MGWIALCTFSPRIFRSPMHIDWKRERLQIPERKAGHWTAYPLAAVVAEALMEYIEYLCPAGRRPRIVTYFSACLRRALQSANNAASATATLYLRKAGVQVRRAAAHMLRHTCVQRLIDTEFPLKTIGDYVGHRFPQSTEIYPKVASALRGFYMNGREFRMNGCKPSTATVTRSRSRRSFSQNGQISGHIVHPRKIYLQRLLKAE